MHLTPRMSLFKISWIFHLLLLSSCLNDSFLVGGEEIEQLRKGNETVLENFIEESLTHLNDASGESLEDHLSDKVDTVAEFLNFGTDQSVELQDAIATAIHLDELLDENEVTTMSPIGVTAPAKRHFEPPTRRPGLLGLLEPEEHNPHILHAKRSADFNGLMNTTVNLLRSLPRGERDLLERVSQEVVSLEDDGKGIDLESIGLRTKLTASRGSALRGLMRLVASVWERGVDVLDRFYQAPDFIMEIPILGNHLRELKKKGEPLYNGIKLLRHSVYLLKFVPLNPNRVSVKNLSKEDRKRVDEAKRMLSKAGATALKAVAIRIIARYARRAISEDAVQECVTRTFYAILGKVLTAGK